MSGLWTTILGDMRQKNGYRVAVAVTLTLAIVAILLFFFSPVKAVDVTPQDSPTTMYSGDNGYGYGNALSIYPTEVTLGEEVTISVTLTNTGNTEETYEVALKINGVVEDTREVTIGSGSSKTVTFTTARNVPGTYTVSTGGLSGSFVVREGAPSVLNWWLIGGIIAGVVAVVTVIWLSVIRKVE